MRDTDASSTNDSAREQTNPIQMGQTPAPPPSVLSVGMSTEIASVIIVSAEGAAVPDGVWRCSAAPIQTAIRPVDDRLSSPFALWAAKGIDHPASGG